MKTLLHKFFPEKEEWILQKADLKEVRRSLENPSRGWYRIYTFCAEQTPDFQPMLWCDIEGDTLVMVIINIGAYKEKDLDEVALENIRTILKFFVKKHYEIILRITYDHEGKALEKEPFFFSTVKAHFLQLIPVINEYAEHIFVYQGMLIGNWGEMHTSRFLQPTKLKELWSILKSELDDRIFTAVRRPACWRLLHMNNEFDNMGLFDDAIFGSENHLGTFGNQSKDSVSWDSLWCKADELNFEDELCQRVPNGGEAICGEQYSEKENSHSTIETLKKMHITYLNKEYDKKLLGIWKEWKWDGPGAWQGCDLYDYIGNHLGYRFWIKDVAIRVSNRILNINIFIVNIGFANIYDDVELVLEFIDLFGNRMVQHLEYDMRKWNSGDIQEVTASIPIEEGKLFLVARRKQDGRQIYFANQELPDGRVFLGRVEKINKV